MLWFFVFYFSIFCQLSFGNSIRTTLVKISLNLGFTRFTCYRLYKALICYIVSILTLHLPFVKATKMMIESYRYNYGKIRTVVEGTRSATILSRHYGSRQLTLVKRYESVLLTSRSLGRQPITEKFKKQI